ncbi:MAG: RIP metalloprotease RseP [Gammaproteobacteria bacterium RIFCSPHIGHO2_12_FULL_37_14]|nr:MAG: RIP metalloprotease RseP [Gammaproteobacteria bacterium RIFCSPHIGHO2_12_FULL_37_14]
MHLIISIFGILFTLIIVIGIHEFAHFITARWFGVKVLRFSIGFGKTIFRWRDKKNTEYVVALIPLGGYVKMLDESEGYVSKHDLALAYNRQPFYKKFLIVLAGPIANLVCAIFFYWLIFMIGFATLKPIIGKIDPGSIAAVAGLKENSEIIAIDQHETLSWQSIFFRIIAHAGNQDTLTIKTKKPNHSIQTYHLNLSNWSMDNLSPDPLGSLGLHPYTPTIRPIIRTVKENSPAALANLQVNDKLIAVNQKKIKDWYEFVKEIEARPNQTLTFTIERNAKKLEIPVTIGYQFNTFFQKEGFLGIAPQVQWSENIFITVQYGPGEAILHAWKEVVNFTYFNFILIGKLVSGKISLHSLGGPITIFESAGEALNSGMLAFLSFLAFISVSIGILNLLPIPGLDGSHLFIQIIEVIIRRPLPEKLLITLYRLGFIFIFFIMLQAFINDILRL